MELSINLGYVASKRFGGEAKSYVEAAKMCLDAGFNILDFSPKTDFDGWKEKVQSDTDTIHSMGMTVHQSHAPYNRYSRIPTEEFAVKFGRSMEAARIMGAKQIVVHGDEYVSGDGKYDPDAACASMYEFLAPFVEFAKKNGFGVAIENLFEDGCFTVNGERSRFTSKAEEVLALIERFNDPAVTCCWDFGHAHVAFGDSMLDELKKIGGKLSSTHVHDNYYGKDLHLPLFLGDIDWKSHMDWLKSLGYAGNMTYEFVYGNIPKERCRDFLLSAHKDGELLLSM